MSGKVYGASNIERHLKGEALKALSHAAKAAWLACRRAPRREPRCREAAPADGKESEVMTRRRNPLRSSPAHLYVGSANVQVKPISGGYSWTIHGDRIKAERETLSSLQARERGNHTRRLYRVNVYLKRSVLANAGLFSGDIH